MRPKSSRRKLKTSRRRSESSSTRTLYAGFGSRCLRWWEIQLCPQGELDAGPPQLSEERALDSILKDSPQSRSLKRAWPARRRQ